MNAPVARILLLIFLALAACTSAEGDVTAVDEVTGALSVSVTSLGSSDFVVTVYLDGPEGVPMRTAPMRLGDNFVFAGLKPGVYTAGTTILGFDCQSASATVQGNQTTAADISCSRRPADTTTGFVAGIVTGGDLPLGGALVELTSSGVELARHTSANGQLSFAGVPVGEYALTAFHRLFSCPVQTIHVDPDQSTTVNVACVPKPTGGMTGIILPFDLGGADVQLTGPTSHTTTVRSAGSSFVFDDLPPGRYTVTASVFAMRCTAVSADVQAARDTEVEIRCESRPPLKSEIGGEWGLEPSRVSATGTCPPVLSHPGTGSIAFRSNDSTIEFVGLDPQVAMVGRYDEESGAFAGSGSTVLGDGTTIRSEANLRFSWDFWDFGGLVFSTDFSPFWTRRHSDPSGNLFCTEVYGAFGWRINW